MIPYELRFHGVRDYEPTKIDLSGEGKHIVIGGPNGSGKSTLTFCMGAVLYSNKVDVMGLKSRNIADDQTWRAAIHFLFKNEGPTRIDAPLYIEFSLAIEQVPNEPIKRVFTISEGDSRDQLEEKSVYRSGGQPNFSDYRLDLIDKYRIYPDHYYLIWYQQEVNQFAIMSPEERFRVFSEMHGISNIQKNWEESLLQVKEIETSVREAENAVHHDRINMLQAKNMYERLKSHLNSLERNGRIMIQTLIALKEQAKEDLITTEGIMEELAHQKEDDREALHQKRVLLEENEEKLKVIKKEKENQQHRLDQYATQLEQTEEKREQLATNEQQLSEQLKEIEEKGKWLRYSEEETKSRFNEHQKNVNQLKKRQTKQIEQLTKLDDEKERIYEHRAELKINIHSYEQQAKEYADLLEQYKSRHHVQERIRNLEDKISKQHMIQSEWTHDIMEREKELEALEENQVISTRQQEVIDDLRQRNIPVYALQSLVELQAEAPLKAEEKVAAIKYTIFYDADQVQPINDLYHVSLQKIVPKQFIDRIPELHLEMRKDLSDQEKTYAAKALWWIKQFTSKEKPYIEDSILIDSRGLRGPQERGTYILSARAIERRKKELAHWLRKKRKEWKALIEQQKRNQEELNQLHGVVHRVTEAEAFSLQKPIYERNLEKVEAYEKRLKDIVREEEKLMKEIDEIKSKVAEHKNILKHLQEDLSVYKQLGEQAQQFERLNELRHQLKHTNQTIEGLKQQIAQLNRLSYQTENRMSSFQHQVRQAKHNIEDLTQEIFRIEKQIETKEEQKHLLQKEFIAKEKKLFDLEQMIPDIYAETMILDPLPKQSKVSLENQLFQAEREFELTRKEEGINYEAEEIYKKAKENYEEKSAELDQLKILLEENIERAEENEQNLITTIQMKILRIHQSFQNYMTHFQFECEVSFDKYEERNGRVNFRLFIKARKLGHRGTMEDVGAKARAGKVGQGVSGGEESLSSLLFALSLLQELDINPSFIVLDEFDSALDEERKAKVFDLYAKVLGRKLIIISPKEHEDQYLSHFGKAYIASHDPTEMKTSITGIRNHSIHQSQA